MTAVDCRKVTVSYGEVQALSEVDLTVEEGETLALLGPSGSGKTTLAYAVAGLVPLSGGEVRMGGEVVANSRGGRPPDARRVGMVFQNYALWPHMDALDIVAYPLRREGHGKPEARRRAAELMGRLGIGELAGRRPAELSGGQQQRVGLARALARPASLYLFDEPTAHLDAAVRAVVQSEVGRSRRDTGAAAIYSTHDAAEALAIADRVALLRDGGVVQVGTPRQVYDQPADQWAAELTGPVSVLSDGRLVRPDWVVPSGTLPGPVTDVRFRGTHTDYLVTLDAGPCLIRLPGPPRYQVGDVERWTVERSWSAA